MSVFMKGITVFHVNDSGLFEIDVEEALLEYAFEKPDASTYTSIGWSSPFPQEDDKLSFSSSGNTMLNLSIAKKLLPAKVINDKTKEKAREIEEQQGYKPGRKQMKEIKETVTDTLLPQAFTVVKDVSVVFLQKQNLLLIDSTSNTVVDEVLSMIVKTFEHADIEFLRFDQNISSTLNQILIDEVVTEEFMVDDESEIRSSGDAVVKYTNKPFNEDDVKRHLGSGGECTKLAMTWDNKVSFVIDDEFKLKKIKFLDILKEENVKGEDAFLSNFELFTQTMSALISDLFKVFKLKESQE